MHDDEKTPVPGTALSGVSELSTVPEGDVELIEAGFEALPNTREVEEPSNKGEVLPVVDVMAEAPSLVFTVTSEPKELDDFDIALDEPSEPQAVPAAPIPAASPSFDWDAAPTRPLPLPPSPPAPETGAPAWDGQLPLRELPEAPLPGSADSRLTLAGAGSLLGLLLVASAGLLFLLVGGAPGAAEEIVVVYRASGSMEGAAALAPQVFFACAAALGIGFLLLGLCVPLLTIRSSIVAWCVATAVLVILVGAGLVGWESRGPVAAQPTPSAERSP